MPPEIIDIESKVCYWCESCKQFVLAGHGFIAHDGRYRKCIESLFVKNSGQRYHAESLENSA